MIHLRDSDSSTYYYNGTCTFKVSYGYNTLQSIVDNSIRSQDFNITSNSFLPSSTYKAGVYIKNKTLGLCKLRFYYTNSSGSQSSTYLIYGSTAGNNSFIGTSKSSDSDWTPKNPVGLTDKLTNGTTYYFGDRHISS